MFLSSSNIQQKSVFWADVNCTGVHSPFSLMRWGMRAAETLESMLDVSMLPFPPLRSASVCAPAHSGDADVSFLTQRSIFQPNLGSG